MSKSVLHWNRFTLLMLALLGFASGLMGCSSGEQSYARARYNRGIELLAQGDLDKSEQAFLDARSEARGDQPLRYAAAFNLGMLHVQKADDLELSEPQKALEQLGKARHWFQDAARVLSDEKDARANLQIVDRKSQVLADQINQGKNGLEARLDRLIEDERGLRNKVRELMEEVKKAEATAEPIAFREAFDVLATTERELMAEAGTIGDLADDELAGLDAQDPKEMQQEDAMRQMQLRGLSSFLQSGRVAIDDARRALRKLDGIASHDRTTAALADLKRAREQLLDPVSALKAIAQDQNSILQHTAARLALGKNTLKMPGKKSDSESAQKTPQWLSPGHLSQREGDVWQRSSEILARFQAASSAPPPVDPSSVDPKAARTLEMAGKAVPFLEEGVKAMDEARVSLDADHLEEAQRLEMEAMRNLMRAIEHFSELRNLIELSYAEQQGVVTLLDPSLSGANEALAKMSTEKRTQESSQATLRNADRISRMKALIEEELATAKAKAEQEGQEAPEQMQELYTQAEKHRSAAEEKLGVMKQEFELISSGQKLGTEALSPLELAQQTQKELEELRRLFFSIVEHLKELHREQSETYDETGTAQAVGDEEKSEALFPLSESQAKHAQMAEALMQALEKQAEAAGASEDPKAAAEAEKFSGAAAEMRSALEALSTASAALTQAKEDAQGMSVDLSSALEEQPIGIEHIAAAIAILEPPQDQENQDQDDKNQDQEEQEDQEQQDQKKDQKKEQEEISKQQAERRLQEIRDREAERRRKQEEGKPAQAGGVEKDW